MDKFLAEVKTGDFSRSARPKRMKLKGGMDQVRRQMHREGGVRSGNIWKYSMLGSQNAITEMPEPEPPKKSDKELADEIAKKVVEDLEKNKPTPTPPAPEKPEPPSPPPAPEPPKPAPKKEPRQPPSVRPPFDLNTPEGKRLLKEYDDYYIDTYGYKESEDIREALRVDSREFTDALRLIRKINLSIKKAPAPDKFEMFGRALLDKFADGIIEILGIAVGAGAKRAGIPDIATGTLIESVKEIARDFKPSNPKDFTQTMRELRAKLLEGKPHWKSKYEEIAKAEFKEKVTKEIKDMDQGMPAGTGADPGKKKKKV